MADAKHLARLKKGVRTWNRWRDKFENFGVSIDLSDASLIQAKLSGAELSGANLKLANLREADLSGANLKWTDLWHTNIRKGNLRGASLDSADLSEADLTGANLIGADLSGADLSEAILFGANLSQANLSGANIGRANLNGCDLSEADLSDANLREADLREVDLSGASLFLADLNGANLSGANLNGADLTGASLLQTTVDRAKISSCSIYGISVWDLDGDFEEQKDLVITPPDTPAITVDNIKVAQFVYLILNNKELRDVINAFTSKVVLILGRFALPERKAILDALKTELRGCGLLPVVFDFDRPTDKDFTETIKTLAGLSYFVIADVTNPKSSPLELQATVPDYQIPFVPIIQEGEQPFAMMADLQKKYPWVLDTLSYNSVETLIKSLRPAIIDPAIKKHNELRLIKAREPKIRSAHDFMDDKGLDGSLS